MNIWHRTSTMYFIKSQWWLNDEHQTNHFDVRVWMINIETNSFKHILENIQYVNRTENQQTQLDNKLRRNGIHIWLHRCQGSFLIHTFFMAVRPWGLAGWLSWSWGLNRRLWWRPRGYTWCRRGLTGWLTWDGGFNWRLAWWCWGDRWAATRLRSWRVWWSRSRTWLAWWLNWDGGLDRWLQWWTCRYAWCHRGLNGWLSWDRWFSRRLTGWCWGGWG